MSRLSPPKPAGGASGPPGPNPLFWGTVGAIFFGIIAAALADGGRQVAESNLVYRLIVGGIVFATAYAVVAALWFAWHRKTFQKVGLGPASGEAPAQDKEVTRRDAEVQEFMDTTTDVVEDLEARLKQQEERDGEA